MDLGYNYAGLGRWIGCEGKSDVKRCKIFKITVDNDGEWLAMGVYNKKSNKYIGNKCIGITATTNKEKRKLAIKSIKDIIKNDVNNWDELYWIECSGKIEEYYKQTYAIPIQNIYLDYYLGEGSYKSYVNNEDNDGFHYYRTINNTIQKKIIYGFNSIDTFNKIKEYIDYKILDTLLEISKKYKKQYNIEDKSDQFITENEELLDMQLPIELKHLIHSDFLNKCYEYYLNGLSELPYKSRFLIQKSIDYLINYIKYNQSLKVEDITLYNTAISYGKHILNNSELIIHKL